MKMRLLSQVFQPLITIPKNAVVKSTEITCKSQKLLMECGLIRPTSTGFFTILPLARRALDKLEAKIIRAMSSVNAQRISMPVLTRASLWKKSGRLTEYQELMTVVDRHDKKYLLSPTFEEAIAELIADVGPVSHKQLPLLLYQLSNKYRDEPRPKHGLLRAREFLMLDAYGIHANDACAQTSYERVRQTYQRLFRELGLEVYKVPAPPGDMGGSLSHEWHISAPNGEDVLTVCDSCRQVALGDKCGHCGAEGKQVNSVEVAHTFILGTKYSQALGATFTPPSGSPQHVHMACYGIGVTRLLAASIDGATSDNVRWPNGVAPYSLLIIGPKEGSKEWSVHGSEAIAAVYNKLSSVVQDDDVILDDRHQLTIGKRLMMADKMGYPNIVVCGRGILNNPPQYELYAINRNQDKPTMQLMSLDEIVNALEQTDKHEENKAVN